MKFPQFNFLLILGVFLFLACGENRITEEAKNRNANTESRMLAEANSTPASDVKLDVPYVPTHEMVVNEMLAMAKVNKDDVLYDLGSGDGRIPITAAKRFGTRGVGIDLNPVRVNEAKRNAENEEVTDKVEFIEGDIFDHDFSKATVLTLYLLPEVNLKLRPKILEMEPGTRVVSHNYHMEDWEPEVTKELKTPDGEIHYVYFWRVPEKKQ